MIVTDEKPLYLHFCHKHFDDKHADFPLRRLTVDNLFDCVLVVCLSSLSNVFVCIRYKKFKHAKDLSNKSTEELKAILGEGHRAKPSSDDVAEKVSKKKRKRSDSETG